MALHEPIHHQPKTLAEGAVCFACALGLLGIAAVALQWAISALL